MAVDRHAANEEALKRILRFEPFLVDVQRALDVIPGMKPNMILTSGPPTPWSEMHGIQRKTICLGAVYEGLAADVDEAAAQLDAGTLVLESTQAHGCAGAATGVYTASMPVYVVEDRTSGRRAFCNIVEGNPPRVFALGGWGDDIRERLAYVNGPFARLIKDVLRLTDGGLPLKPIFRRALGMGDDLHYRLDSACLMWLCAMFPHFLTLAREREREDDVRQAIQFLQTTPISFLRVAMAAAKTALDAAHGVEGSSMVTGIIHNCNRFAIRVSGLGDRWFGGAFPDYLGDYFWGSGPDDIAWAGGESSVMETAGLGGMVIAAAFALPNGGPSDVRINRNRQMYDITLGENPEFKIPYFGRGSPTGIDVFKVVETGIRPFMQGGLVRKDGNGAAGVGPMVLSIESFAAAREAYREQYGL